MRSLLLVLCVLVCQIVNSAKIPSTQKRSSSTDADASQLVKLELEEIVKLEQLDEMLKGELAKDTSIEVVWALIVNTPIFQQDQMPLIKEAAEKNYDSYLTCITHPHHLSRLTEEDCHWILALLFDTPWFKKSFSDVERLNINWRNNIDAAIKADNQALVDAYPEIFEAALKDPALISKFIKYDSVNLVKCCIKDLNAFTTKAHEMVTAGSIKILRFLTEQDVLLDIDDISLKDACRDVEILHLLYESGYQIDLGKKALNSFIAEEKIAHLDFFHKIDAGNLLTLKNVTKVAIAGHSKVFEWAVGKDPTLLPPDGALERIAKNGHLNILQSIFRQDLRRTIPCPVIVSAVFEGHAAILDWARKVDPKIIERCKNALIGVNDYVCERGNADGVAWLYWYDSRLVVPFEASHLSKATRLNNLDVLRMAYGISPKALLTIEDLNLAAGEGYTELIKWVHSQKAAQIPDSTGANLAAISGRILTLKWLASENVYPTQAGFNGCVECGELEGLRWIMTKFPNMVAPPSAIIKAAETGRIGVLKLIHKFNPRLLDNPKLQWVDKNWEWKEVGDFLVRIGKRPALTKNMDATIKADNAAFVIHPETFDTKLKHPTTIISLIKYDSASLVRRYVEDLSVFTTKAHEMVTAGSIKLLRLLIEEDVPLYLNDISLEDACRNLEILRLLYGNGYRVNPTEKMLDTFMAEGKVVHLDFFYKISVKNLPSQNGVAAAAKAGHLEALQWAVSLSQDPIACHVVIEAASEGNENVLNWACTSDPDILKRCSADFTKVKTRACENGKLAGLKWFQKHGQNIEISFSAYQLSLAARHNNLNVLKFAHSNNPEVSITIDDLNFWAGKGNLAQLQWAYSIDEKLLPNHIGANSAMVNGQILVVEWLISKNRRFEPNACINKCVELGKLKAVHWMIKKFSKLCPSYSSLLKAAENGRLGTIRHILKTRPHVIEHGNLKRAARAKGWTSIVDFLKTDLDNSSVATILTEITSQANAGNWGPKILVLLLAFVLFHLHDQTLIRWWSGTL